MFKRCSRSCRLLCIAVGVLACLAAVSKQVFVWRQLDLARQALGDSRPDEAVSILQRTVEWATNNAEVHYRLAVAERRNGNLSQSARSLRRAAALGWSKSDIDRQSMLAIVQSGRLESVEPEIKALMTSGVSDEIAEEVYEALAMGYLSTYRLSEAWKCLTSWSQWQPKAIFPKLWRADICRRIKNLKFEEQEYRELLAISPNHIFARIRLAKVLTDTGRIDEAITEYQLCLAQTKTRPDILIGLADCSRRNANWNAAIVFLRNAEELSLSKTDRAAVLHLRSQMESELGHIDNAVKMLEEASALAPQEAAYLYSLAQLYARKGNDDDSRKCDERSRWLQSQNVRVEDILQKLLNAPDDADLRYELGTIMIELGMKQEGVGWLHAALRINPSHLDAQKAISAIEPEIRRDQPVDSNSN